MFPWGPRLHVDILFSSCLSSWSKLPLLMCLPHYDRIRFSELWTKEHFSFNLLVFSSIWSQKWEKQLTYWLFYLPVLCLPLTNHSKYVEFTNYKLEFRRSQIIYRYILFDSFSIGLYSTYILFLSRIGTSLYTPHFFESP